MRRLLAIVILAAAPCILPAQTITEADIPVVQEIQTTILDLVTKAVNNFESQRGAEAFRDSSMVMYEATPTDAMHAQNYYITYANKNQKSYYMNYYTDEHDELLAMTAFLTMNAFAGEKWKTEAVPHEAGSKVTDLYCAGVKLGRMQVFEKDKAVAISVGFFTDPGDAETTDKTSSAPAASAASDAGNGADHFKSIDQRMADIHAGLMERHGAPIKHAEEIVSFSEGRYSEIITYGMLAYYYSGFKRYFISPTLYSKKYPIPFGARFTYQLVDSKNNVVNQQTKSGTDLECYFDIPEDGDYTIQAAYDFNECAGCADVSGIRVQFGLYSQDFDRKQP